MCMSARRVLFCKTLHGSWKYAQYDAPALSFIFVWPFSNMIFYILINEEEPEQECVT